jgi:hypothetical protein
MYKFNRPRGFYNVWRLACGHNIAFRIGKKEHLLNDALCCLKSNGEITGLSHRSTAWSQGRHKKHKSCPAILFLEIMYFRDWTVTRGTNTQTHAIAHTHTQLQTHTHTHTHTHTYTYTHTHTHTHKQTRTLTPTTNTDRHAHKRAHQ